MALRRRQVFAVLATLVWLLGVELGPGLHIARHAELGHHHHGAAEQLACQTHEDGALGAEFDGSAHEHHATAEHHEHHEHHAVAEHHEHHATAEHHEHHATAEHHAAPPELEHADVPAAPIAPATDVLAAAPHVHPLASEHTPGTAPHGSGSLDHRDLFSLTAPDVLPPLLSAPWQPCVVATARHIAPRDRTPGTLRARGPPSDRITLAPSALA